MQNLKMDEGPILEIVARHAAREGPLLPILHDLQAEHGCVPAAAVPVIAEALNLSRAEVHGTISFYHDFRPEPAPLPVLKQCRAEACQARGARVLEAHAKHVLGIDFGATTRDGAVTLEAVYCLGNCACGPSLLVDGDELHANVTPARFDALLAQWREAAP